MLIVRLFRIVSWSTVNLPKIVVIDSILDILTEPPSVASDVSPKELNVEVFVTPDIFKSPDILVSPKLGLIEKTLVIPSSL